MAKFYIKQLIITGEGKTPSFIDFNSGLNIIYGVSDTGKTCIIKCIDYIFGSRVDSPIPKTHGYTNVKLVIQTDKGMVSFERVIDKNKITIVSENPDFESGSFTLQEIGQILLNLIGIKQNTQIIKNSNYERINLTWRTFMHSFLIHENEVIQKTPILIAPESVMKTASLSALIYLISAPDFSKFDASEDKKIREARKKAVETYIANEMDNLLKQKNELDEILKSSTTETPEQKIQLLTNELAELEKLISIQIGKSQNTLSKIIEQKDKIAECNMLLNRYNQLASQYEADIKRLSFIVSGEEAMEKIVQPQKCPFCENDIDNQHFTSYVATANVELTRIVNLLQDLQDTIQSVKEEKSQYYKSLKELSIERNNIETLINKTLNPQIKAINKQLQDYRNLVRLENEIEVIDKMRELKSQALTEMMASKEEKPAEYKPREHFPQDFEETMTKILNDILKKCKYENLVSARFSLKDFDVIVNAKNKEDFGKGLMAFLNTTVALVMREYLHLYGKYQPGFLIIDSPLLSLYQGVEDAAPESMKTALMNYLMDTQDRGQTIIIENKIPDLDYSSKNVKMHNFTKGRSSGRYGLLIDVVD